MCCFFVVVCALAEGVLTENSGGALHTKNVNHLHHIIP